MLSVKISSCRRSTQRRPGRVDLPSRQVRGKGPQVCRRRCYRNIGRIHTDNSYKRKQAQVTPRTPTSPSRGRLYHRNKKEKRKTFIQSIFGDVWCNFPKETGVLSFTLSKSIQFVAVALYTHL